jgi:homoserine kinase type II
MALLTPLPDADAARLAESYGLVLAEIEALRAGSVNSNFRLLDTRGQQFFLRIYEEQDRVGAAREVDLLGRLGAAGVPSARPVCGEDGEWLRAYAGKPVALFEWVAGTIVCQKQVTPEHAARIGSALAAVHGIEAGSLAEGRFRIEDLERRLDFIEANAEADLALAARSIRKRLLAAVAERSPALPRGLVHGDLFRDNVLWREGEVCALLDFESASQGAFVYDLAVTLMAWCYGERFDPKLVEAMVSGYERVRPLSAEERSGLVNEGRIAALRFATTRITDFSMRTPAGGTPGRDYRRFLGRLDAIEQGVFNR